MTTPYLAAVSIDVECDKDARWDVPHPLSFRGVEEGIDRRLAPLFREFAVRPTYLVSPEVMRHGPSVAVLKADKDCELGTHLHPEFVFNSEGVRQTTAVPCLLPEAEERRLLGALTSQFVDTFGRPPLSYRAGRYGVSARSLHALADLGYLVDTSVTPHKAWDYGLDFRAAPDSPYFASPDRVDVPGPAGGLLEIPVSLRPSPAPALVRQGAKLLAHSHVRVARDWAKWSQGPLWFRPAWSSRRTLLRFVKGAAAGEYAGVLNMMFHNVDFVAGCSPNAVSDQAVQAALADLRAVFGKVRETGGCFATLTEIRTKVAES